MRLSIPAITICMTCLAAAACDDDAAVTGGPSAFKNELGLVAIGSPVLDWSIPRPCSPVGPVPVPFTLHVTTGASPITLSEVRFQAMDASRSIAPPTIFDASSLTRQFGSITVAGFGVRHFPFTYPFGCIVGGTIVQTSVTITDTGGVSRVQTMQVPVY